MRKTPLIAAAAAVALVPAGVAGGASKAKTFTTTLTGKAEVPGPGDSNGKGSAVITIRGSKLCYDIKLREVNGSAAGHIHQGAKGKSGPVVVALFGDASTAKRRKGCVTPDADDRAAIAKNPKGFYVNVHNADFPDGAVRGQLKKR